MTPSVLPLACLAARSRDAALLAESTSGGIFSELAREVFRRGGVVAGAVWERNPLRAIHRVAGDEAGLEEMRGSKYVPSDLKEVWRDIDRALAEGRMVLFSGVPCQIAAVKRRYPDAPGLLTCGVVCHGGIAPDVWHRYVLDLEKKARSRLVNVRFRDKTDGWRRSHMVFEFADSRRNFSRPAARDPYIRAFLADYSLREACLSCRFRAGRAGMDILLGDFWGIENHLPEWGKDDRGTSAVMLYTEHGRELFDSLDVEKHPVEYGWIVAGNPMLERPPEPDAAKRTRFRGHFAKRGVATALRIAEEGHWLNHMILAIRRRLQRLADWPRRRFRP